MPPEARPLARTTPRTRDRDVLGQLLHGEVARRGRAGSSRSRRRGRCARRCATACSWCAQVHPVDELGLAGEVDVVGAGGGAGRDQRLAVLQVGAHGRDHDAGALGDVAQRGGVADVGVQQRQVGAAPGRSAPAGRAPAPACPGCARPAPSGTRSGACAARYSAVSAAGEAGGAEQHDVEPAVCLLCHGDSCRRVGAPGNRSRACCVTPDNDQHAGGVMPRSAKVRRLTVGAGVVLGLTGGLTLASTARSAAPPTPTTRAGAASSTRRRRPR